jgi:hypothetical protein
MDTKSPEIIQQDYATNTWLTNRLIEGINDHGSLLQLPFPTNHLGQLEIQRAYALSQRETRN